MMPLILAITATAAPPINVPAQPQLTEQIRRADSELFDLFFVKPCDEPRFRALIADDVEFYHDKDGLVTRSAEDFMKAYKANCASRIDPAAWRSRREPIAASFRVDPVPGWGAMETGDHVFYERHGVNGAESLAGKARFAMVWALGADGKWRVSRILSYAHEKARQ
jgi:hypothetical protein